MERGCIPHVVDRMNLYNDVISLYTVECEKMLSEYPVRVRFKDELAVDIGGVTRDMFSAFYSEAYLKIFDGTSSLFPVNHAGVDMSVFPTLGTIMSHAYLVSGVLPDRVAFPYLAAALLGMQISIDAWILEEAFVSCLSTHEAAVLREAIGFKGQTFPSSLQSEVTLILGSYGCRGLAHPHNVRELIVQASRFVFLVKPAAAIGMMNAGVPEGHRSFWSMMSVDKLYQLYKSISVSVVKVLNLLQEPVLDTPSKEEVWLYV